MIAIDDKSLFNIKNKIKELNGVGNNIRIYFSGVGFEGPNFNMTLDSPKDDDLVYKIDDLTFLLSQYEYMQYGDIKIDLDENNNIHITPKNMELSMCCGHGCPDCPY
ncbi:MULTISPECIES: hypothetical protein [unclassified Romboutsia]|uniref:hypothetical protein n=1 Tax=unclassified Romboutsia TaxID=2626894 RepID=UPI000F04A493|nr:MULTISPECIES: hypothetical protein [unclassified Romboutsia]